MAAKTLSGKTALVTGAGSGIGRALCQSLAARGAYLIVTDLDATRALETAGLLQGAGEAHTLDVRDAEAFQCLAGEVEQRFGGVDLLFNNAGVAVAGEAHHCTLEDWRFVLDVNLMGAVHGIQAVYPGMVERRRGHILNTSSLSGLLPLPGGASYTASKFAVVGMSMALRTEARQYGVGVSVLCPGVIDTPIFEATKKRGMTGESLRDNLGVAPVSARECAETALRGMERNEDIILVPEYAKAVSLAYRFAPGITRWFANQVFQKAKAAPVT